MTNWFARSKRREITKEWSLIAVAASLAFAAVMGVLFGDIKYSVATLVGMAALRALLNEALSQQRENDDRVEDSVL